jgi:uncharacterized protein (DUF433 family)
LKFLKELKNHIALGNGIYTIPDLALILGLPQSKVRRWLTDFYDQRLGKSHKGKYSWTTGNKRGTNFLTLIEFYVFYQLRSLKFSTHKILEVHSYMEKTLNTPYPFASYELLAGQKQILYKHDEETLVRADKTNQIVLKEILEKFCQKIDFSEQKIATRFWPMGKKHRIVVDPHHQFGQPVIYGTNINAETIWSMYNSGEAVSTIGVLYDISTAEVNDAISFCQPKAA